MIAGAVASPHAQDVASAVSVDRVRTALERPPSKVTLAEVKPDFHIEVVWRHPFHEIFDVPPWVTPSPGWKVPPMPARTANGTIPMVNFDLLSIARSIGDSRRASAARNASEEVQREIAAYCAAQPNVAEIQICSTSRAIR